MTDVHSKETRSYNMSRIRAKDTKPELLVRKYLFSKGFRYRLNVKNFPGNRISYSQNTTLLFLSTVVSGTDMKIVRKPVFRKQKRNGGKQKSQRTRNGTSKNMQH